MSSVSGLPVGLGRSLTDALGADAVVAEPVGAPSWRDGCRHALGRPVATVRPVDTEGVRAVVRAARDAGVRVVAVGHRTAYWRPLAVDGALALDVSAMRGVLEHALDEGWLRVAAGTPVRELDTWLRQRGHRLAVHPDAFGETSVGAMVAIDLAAGIGMGHGTIGDLLVGLTAVDGRGEVLRTGTSHQLGAPPFLRAGAPDPTGLLLGAEGALAVVTEVVLRPLPAPWLGQLSWTAPAEAGSWALLAGLNADLSAPGLVDTFRVEHRAGPWGGGPDPRPLEVDLTLQSPLSQAELAGRLAYAEAAIARRFPAAQLERVVEAPEGPPTLTRWQGGPGEHAQLLGGMHFAAVDALVAPPGLPGLLEALAPLRAAVVGGPHRIVRLGVYLAPRRVNVGLQVGFPVGEDGAATAESRALAERFVEAGVAALAPLPMTPYRLGRTWVRALAERMDPTWLGLMDAVQAHLDPDGVLNPDVSIFGR